MLKDISKDMANTDAIVGRKDFVPSNHIYGYTYGDRPGSDGRRKPTPEEIYSAKKAAPQRKSSVAVGTGVAVGMGSTASRPVSAATAKGRGAPTIVDRAVAVGSSANFAELTGAGGDKTRGAKGSAQLSKDEIARSKQLADMFDEGIIGKLDCIILPKSRWVRFLQTMRAVVLLPSGHVCIKYITLLSELRIAL